MKNTTQSIYGQAHSLAVTVLLWAVTNVLPVSFMGGIIAWLSDVSFVNAFATVMATHIATDLWGKAKGFSAEDYFLMKKGDKKKLLAEMGAVSIVVMSVGIGAFGAVTAGLVTAGVFTMLLVSLSSSHGPE